MRDHNHRDTIEFRFESVDERGFRLAVHCSCCFIEDQHRTRRRAGRPGQGAGHGDCLALAARKAFAAVGKGDVIAIGQCADEIMRAGQPRCAQHRGIVKAGVTQGDIVANAARQQYDILKHRADIGAQVVGMQLAQVGIVDDDGAVLGLIQPEQQPGEGRFARADAADDGNAFAGRDGETDAVERAVAGAGIAEADAIEDDAPGQPRAAQRAGWPQFPAPDFAGCRHQPVEAAIGAKALRHACQQRRDLPQRCDGAPRQHRCGDKRPHRQRPLRDQRHAQRQRRDIDEALHRDGDVDGDRSDAALPQRHGGVFVDGGPPAPGQQWPGQAGLDGFQPGDRLDDDALLAQALRQTCRRQAVEQRLRPQGDDDDDRHGDQWHQRQRRRDDGDDGDVQQDERHIDERDDGRRSEQLAQRLELAEQAGKGTVRPGAIDQLHRQQPVEDGAADLHVDVHPGDIDEIAAQRPQQQVHADDQDDADDQRQQRLGGIVGNDLVVDRHREQRRGDAEQVDERRRHRDLAEQAAIGP